MDIAATLAGITVLTVEERIRIVQAILESIDVAQAYPELTLELKQELDRRQTRDKPKYPPQSTPENHPKSE